MYTSCPDKTAYTARIDALKRQNLAEMTPRRGGGLRRLARLLRARRFADARRLLAGKFRKLAGLFRRENVSPRGVQSVPSPDYFSDDRIAVYTVIFGNYDRPQEPMCHPDNCDYFLIGDQTDLPEGSVWQTMTLPDAVTDAVAGMTASEKNRYLKMMPHRLFPDYPCSVYLDGNIRLVTDPTEFVNRLPAQGAAFHRHVSRDCVYDEIRAVLDQKKAPEEAMRRLTAFLREEQMPPHYGLLECPVIVRRHNDPACRELMEAWWEVFERFPCRDQVLLPYVLFKRGIRPEELACLGDNVRKSPSFRRYPHTQGGPG